MPGYNLTLKDDSGSKFNVELRPHKSTWNQKPESQLNWGQNFIRQRGSQFSMKNQLNPEHSPLNQDPTGRNSFWSKFNPTQAFRAGFFFFITESYYM